ncbi:MAG: long-chain-fatty-acid--CoA ligase [Candidatus Helarchaeota archaeon]
MTFKVEGERIWHQHYPEGVPKNLDIPDDISIDDIFKETAAKYPDFPVMSFKGQTWTYKWLDDQVDRFAKSLQDMGLQKGDRVAINVPNTPQYLIGFFGVMRAGGVVSPIVPLQKAAEIRHQINDSGSKFFIIFDAFFEEEVQKIVDELPTVKKFILTGMGEYLKPLIRILGNLLGKIPRMKKWPEGPRYAKFQDLLQSEGKPKPVKFDTKKDLAVLMYTGGTTGLPKGAMLSQYNLVSNLYQCAAWIVGTKPGEEATVGALPFSHIFGLTTMMMMAIKLGGKCILIPNPRDIPDLIKTIVKEKGTLFSGVNALFNRINNHPKAKKFDLSTLRSALSGAGPLAKDVQEKFEAMTGARIVEGYGLTETSPVVFANPLGENAKRKIGTVGMAFPNTDCKIVDPETKEEIPQPGKEDDISTHGEIAIKGPQVFLGYYNRPDATKKDLRDGWVYTGDIGYFDEEGYLHIMDRMKDMIKYKGHSVYPREVEDLMYQYEPINEVGVIGVKNEKGEENIKAFVSLKPEYKGKVSVEDIQNWCKDNIAGYKWPRIIEIIDEVPTTNVGKVLRRKLREREEE